LNACHLIIHSEDYTIFAFFCLFLVVLGFEPPVLFCFNYYLGRVSCFCPGPVTDHSTPHTVSIEAGMTDTHYNIQLLLVEMGISLHFCLSWPQTAMLQISASWVAGITGMATVPGSPLCFNNYKYSSFKFQFIFNSTFSVHFNT
jgi:hypothetical protein